jgi:hypothetical protein
MMLQTHKTKETANRTAMLIPAHGTLAPHLYTQSPSL